MQPRRLLSSLFACEEHAIVSRCSKNPMSPSVVTPPTLTIAEARFRPRPRPRWVLLLLGCSTVVLGCSTVWRPRTTLPLRNATNRGQLVIHSNTELPEHHRLLDELVVQRGDVSQQLGLPTSDEPIHVYLFDSSDRFSAFMRLHYPDFPSRRAFFVESDTRLAVYAHWGDRVAEDLRHEVSHGYLHAVAPNIPLWIDEGLAEYFEVPRGSAGVNRPHVEALMKRLNGGWRPDIARLESLVSAGEMQQLDYAESWGWAHWMLKTTPQRRDLLRNFLLDVRRGVAPCDPLSLRISRQEPRSIQAYVQHIRHLAYP